MGRMEATGRCICSARLLCCGLLPILHLCMLLLVQSHHACLISLQRAIASFLLWSILSSLVTASVCSHLSEVYLWPGLLHGDPDTFC